ncbi:hypothetical protein H7U04_07610 [Streptococcus sp. 22.1]|uniref:hypothetical protein n=1 Tax=Streptococcus sp. 22.1 TaxID=2762565 RepID=UPI0019143017|nr:hypothetical protein [Streptococcus sp. 22.1]MBK5079259.1 hypothetical protein [Streptococcus sp. 22.1]
MRFIEIDSTDMPEKKQEQLLNLLSGVDYRTKDDMIYLTIKQWQENKYTILNKWKKFKDLRVSEIDITEKRQVLIVSPSSKLFSPEFDEMERNLA